MASMIQNLSSLVILTRVVIASCALLCMFTQVAHSACTTPLVKSVLTRHGGLEELSRARTLHWSGTAIIHGDRGDIAIRVRTRLEPFVSARSESWLRDEDASKARVMILEREGGLLERAGVQSRMPQTLYQHERAQFAIYGLMLLAPLCDPDVTVIEDEINRSIVVTHPRAPTTTLFFDTGGHLIRARNSVPAPDGKAHVDQEFRFASESMPGRIHWPRTVHIEQNGKPYFDLTLERFEAVAQP